MRRGRAITSGGWARSEQAGYAIRRSNTSWRVSAERNRSPSTGKGVAPEKLGHLFDRFWQADDGGRGAAGLGLAIVKGVVDAHGGEVTVQSELGRGTTFRMRFTGETSDHTQGTTNEERDV